MLFIVIEGRGNLLPFYPVGIETGDDFHLAGSSLTSPGTTSSLVDLSVEGISTSRVSKAGSLLSPFVSEIDILGTERVHYEDDVSHEQRAR